MTANRVIGALLMLVGVPGFLMVADDLRHTGELVGVCAIVAAGAILLLGGVRTSPISVAAARFVASGILLGIPLGGALDRMLPGVVVGAAAGTAGALLARRRLRPEAAGNLRGGNPMDLDLTTLSDTARIVETINRLFIATDNRDWPTVRKCFAPRVLFDMSSLGGGEPMHLTPEEIAAAWDAGLKPLRAVHHQTGNHIVRIAGDRAEAFCYGIAIHYLPNPENKNTRTFVGSYDISLVKGAGGWTIAAFRFNLKYIDGNVNLEHPAPKG